MQAIIYKGQKVITTELLAQAYETTTDRIKQNFNRNKERFVEGKHYFMLTGEELKAFKNQVSFSDLVDKRTAQLSKFYAAFSGRGYSETDIQ